MSFRCGTMSTSRSGQLLDKPQEVADISPPALVHCSYHKCLTVYFGRVMRGLFERCLPWSRGYRHYNSDLRAFYAGFDQHRMASVNNRFLDLERLGEARLSRFIRDPRDLVVSGYFYHRRGAEPWVNLDAPTEEDWYFANGAVPEGLRAAGGSFAGYLQSLPEEEGLLAELEFRRNHFESMAQWPKDHPDIVTLRYEDVIKDGPGAFRALMNHYGFSRLERTLGAWLAKRHGLGAQRGDHHVRNPAPGQWRQHFTLTVRKRFDREYGALVKSLGYPTD